MIPFLPDIKKKQLQIVILPPLNYLLCCLNWFTRPVKNLPAMQETPSLIPGSGRSTGEGIVYPLQYSWASLVAQPVKQSACNVGDLGSIPGLGRFPWRRAWPPTPGFLPGQRSLAGSSRKQLDTTE